MNYLHVSSTLFLKIATLALLAGHADAQDVVVIELENGKETKRRGVIVDWQGSKISIENAGRTRTIDMATVKQLNTTWPDALATARDFAAKNQFAEAAKEFQRAKSSETRSWVKTMIAAELLQVFDAAENHALAIREFLPIHVADAESRFFGLIPLAWSVGERNVPPIAQLKNWLANDNPVLRLIAASWLLGRGPDRPAVSALEDLTSNADTRLAQLALAQLWRKRMLSATATDVQRWQQQMERIEPQLRAGPLIVLAQAQNRTGQTELAQINLMKVRILHEDKKTLSAFALYLCGNIMSELRQTDRARTVWRELSRDFPNSQFAALAGNKM